MPSPHGNQTRRQVLKKAAGLLTVLGMGGGASAANGSDSDVSSQSAAPLSGRPDIRSEGERSPDVTPASGRPDIRGVGPDEDDVGITSGRPDIRSQSVEPLSGRPDIRINVDEQDSDVDVMSGRPDIRS